MLEKQLVSFFNALTDILHCLRSNQLPELFRFPQFGDMSLKFCSVQMLTPHPLVAFVEGNTVVIDRSSSVD
jgi:hypothetical protein